MHSAQSMHSSGSMTSILGPSRKQSTGQTSTQSVYLHRMQFSVTTWGMGRAARADLEQKPSQSINRPYCRGKPEVPCKITFICNPLTFGKEAQ